MQVSAIDAEALAHHALAALARALRNSGRIAALLVQHAFGLRDDDLRALFRWWSAPPSEVSRIFATS